MRLSDRSEQAGLLSERRRRRRRGKDEGEDGILLDHPAQRYDDDPHDKHDDPDQHDPDDDDDDDDWLWNAVDRYVTHQPPSMAHLCVPSSAAVVLRLVIIAAAVTAIAVGTMNLAASCRSTCTTTIMLILPLGTPLI